ncbi:MAG: 4Fe-4S binding protein [candidate division KSB1 bacterium]|nr:4Fe-4S binding protein [candidate division KSB1 bacterium]MDZ7301705.1 4Fe-4S binding protein [candidate division KSB1 bacterium]MDZ7312408.1 4Fe-4S binding protein [candidate division KSB1 bacterium]
MPNFIENEKDVARTDEPLEQSAESTKMTCDHLQKRVAWESTPPKMAKRPKKKVPPALRRRVNFSSVQGWNKRVLWRLQEDSQFQRVIVQIAFALLCIWIGVEFHFFMQWGLSAGEKPFFPRPPGVEGFLPISALISLKYWVLTGIINTIHPAGLFILLAVLATGLLLKRSFCSWLCPIGTLSESLWRLGGKLFGSNYRVNRWLDYPLRALKYLLLLFFVWAIWQMDVPALTAFIYSPYNKVADVKMYLFFAQLSKFALWTIFILMLLSLPIKNFWCRYLCPYGGLLAILSWLSPLKITRNQSTCIDCELCTKACPANIVVHKAKRVWSDECTACLACVQACPVRETLDVRTGIMNKKIPHSVFASLVVGLFVAITGLAMLMGKWQNAISKEEYLEHFQQINSPLYQHNRGQVPTEAPEGER